MNIDQPIFQTIFGEQWNKLPKILQLRYANKAYCNDVTTVEGKLAIHFSKLMTIFMPLFQIFNILVPYQGDDIPVTVNFRSNENSRDIAFDRTFNFPGKKSCYFRSILHPLTQNDVIEFTYLRLGWKMKYAYENNKVLLLHNGYVLKFFNLLIPIPLTYILGKIYAEEQVIADDTFRMQLTITHPLFGKMFEYGGEFKMANTK